MSINKSSILYFKMIDSKTDFPQLPEQEADRDFIARGFDSAVYKVDGFVYKVYHSGMDEEVQRYAGLMNGASEFLVEHPRVRKISLGDEDFTCTTEVNPTLLVDRDVEGVPFAIAEYVPGPNLVQLGHQPVEELVDLSPDEREFFSMISRKDLARWRLSAGLEEELQLATKAIADKMGIKGLGYDAINVKVRKVPDQNALRLIFTDLAASISDVTKHE